MPIPFDFHQAINPYAIPPGIAALLNFLLVIWVYVQAPPGRIRRTFLMWNLWVGLWNLGLAVGYSLQEERLAQFWYRFYAPTIVRFITPLFLDFIVSVTES